MLTKCSNIYYNNLYYEGGTMGKLLAKELLKLFALLLIGILITGTLNMFLNQKSYATKAFQFDSHVTGPFGHIQLIRYNHGPIDLKRYHDFGHRIMSSTLYRDTDGDRKIDIITDNGSEFKLNTMERTLVREIDYELNREIFDQADQLLSNQLNRASNEHP